MNKTNQNDVIDTFQVTITGLKPVSINNAYYKYNKTLNAKARAYRSEFLYQLSAHRAALDAFSSKFNKKRHALACNIAFMMPKDQYIAKSSDEISHRSGDIDNNNKLMVDFIFNEKYYGRNMGTYTSYNFNIDDKFITSLCTTKSTNDLIEDYELRIAVSIVNR